MVHVELVLQFQKDNEAIRDGPKKSNENNQACRRQTLSQRIRTVDEEKLSGEIIWIHEAGR